MKRACLIFALLPALAGAQSLRLDGEVFARSSEQVAPPSIPNVWNLNITEFAPDGVPLKPGDMVVVFDGGETQNQLVTVRSQLAEKQSQREQLLLELAERERNEHLATEERRAKLDKAQRKATQPESLVRRVDYKKLVIERAEADELMALTERRERLAAEQRRQERRLIDADIAMLEKKISTLEASLAALRITATRAGVISHRTGWNGEKFAVGSQVFRGQAVAEIPDVETLAVNTQVNERDLTRISTGMRARVVSEGGGAALEGRVTRIGGVVRSKSRVQPVPVVDLLVELDEIGTRLKPGQAVRVELFDAPVRKVTP